MMKKTYSELKLLQTFEERFNYLSCKKAVGDITFGHNRYLNQILYTSKEWKKFRRDIIIRDNGCDLADPDHPIERYSDRELKDKRKYNKIIIHHINPLTEEQVVNRDPCVFDPENVVCVSELTHNAIHYGDAGLLPKEWKPRTPNDTIPWR